MAERTHVIALRVLRAWHDDFRLTREAASDMEHIAIECENDLGRSAEDSGQARSDIATWLRSRGGVEAR